MMQSQTQTISIPVLFNISMSKNTHSNSTANNPSQSITTTTSTSYQSPTIKAYRTYNNNKQSVYMSVSSSSKKTTTTTTRTNRNKNVNNNTSTTAYIKGSIQSKTSTDISFLLSLFSLSFKYIFIITYNVLDNLLYVILNPFETFICVSYKIAQIKSMNRQIEELKNERDQLINQSDQLMVQLNATRICYRNIENSYRAMKQKRDILKDTIKALQNELQRERESRFVVEKCHNERIEKLEFEIDMKEQEIINYEDKEKLLKKKIHKLQKKLKKASLKTYATTSSCPSLPTFSLQNFNPFTFDEPISASTNEFINDEKGISEPIENNTEDLYYSSSEDENYIFVKESEDESCSDSSSDSESESEFDSDSDLNSDLDDIYDDESAPREIPKNSIYFNFGRRQSDNKDEEEEELEVGNGKVEQNPLTILRQEAYNCLYQSLVSELCASSILMDLDVKMDKKNFNSYTCISIILEALVHYLEAKKQLTNKEAIEALFIRYRPLILNYTDSEEDQMNLLVSLEDICIENSLRLQQHLRILMAIYNAELVDPHIIIQWYRLLPDTEEICHRSCPMTPSINCVLPKLPNKSSMKSYNESDCKHVGQMIDGHYATQTIASVKDNANIQQKREGSSGTSDSSIKNETKVITDQLLRTGATDGVEKSDDTAQNNKLKNTNSHGGRSGHARTASGSMSVRRKRSMSSVSDSGNHENYYLGLRKDVRELAKVFALWLESKESSSSDDESLLDSMSMSQDQDDESEDSGNELQRLHQKLLSDEDSCDSPISESSTDVVTFELGESENNITKKCKRVTFNLTPTIDDKDEDTTIHNEEENEDTMIRGKNKEYSLKKDCPLIACLENNPLTVCNNFEFSDEEQEEQEEEEEEEIIEEVEEVIEEEEEVVEEIYEEEIDGENYEHDDESVTIVEEKEEIINEVVECIKVAC